MNSTTIDYLSEATRGDYAEKSEDRLTQTFAATFNHSQKFRKGFLEILGLNTRFAHDLQALTQQAYSIHGSRLDLKLVTSHGHPIAIIESKIEAPLYSEQLERYSGLPGMANVKKVALVKNYFDLAVPVGWKLLHWSDVHGVLSKVSRNWPNDTDSFITRAFLKRLENLRMGRISVIEEGRLRDLAMAAKALSRDGKVFSLSNANIFETAADYVSMLEELVGHIRADAVLSRLLGKNVRFSSKIVWVEDDDERYLWIGYHTGLRKKRNGFKAIGTGICLYPGKGRHEINTYAKSSTYKEFFHRSRSLNFDQYAREALKFWKRNLCGD